MKIKNYMEIIVEEKLDEVIKDMDICKCTKCKGDIVAVTLNRLAPRYVVSQKGILYAKLQSLSTQFEATVVTEIVKSATFVSANQRH